MIEGGFISLEAEPFVMGSVSFGVWSNGSCSRCDAIKSRISTHRSASFCAA